MLKLRIVILNTLQSPTIVRELKKTVEIASKQQQQQSYSTVTCSFDTGSNGSLIVIAPLTAVVVMY